ncbi:MAG: glycosyltransferase [Xenococcaceae cyanobacterium MO_188.B29]|nr:glycosyltransferase [Xenococcaceae cyanobacterium MO_188.B29]
MKKVMFYCQHILGMGHLVRSREIVRGLLPEYQVCFINGGEIIKEFPFPTGVEVVNIPAVKTNTEFQGLQPVDTSLSLDEVKELRLNKLMKVFAEFQPDILIIELFPFGRRSFSFELIPLVEQAKASGTKIVSSLRDIVVTKQNQERHEEKVCRLMNQYFDMLLIHGDRQFVELEESFSRVDDLNCQVHYTGYVTQPVPKVNEENKLSSAQKPMILASVGGGRFGHELLRCLAKATPILERALPHHIQMFTGPFMPEEVFQELQATVAGRTNITIDRYTDRFLAYMQQADLSISMSGYNTTMNILSTSVRAMILPFTGNNDQEQTIRAQKLEKLGRVKAISPEDLQPEKFADQIINYLQEQPNLTTFDFNGVANTATCIGKLFSQVEVAA